MSRLDKTRLVEIIQVVRVPAILTDRDIEDGTKEAMAVLDYWTVEIVRAREAPARQGGQAITWEEAERISKDGP